MASSTTASPSMQYGISATGTVLSTASNISTSLYNAASARAQAKAIESQSNLQAYLIRKQYTQEYEELQAQQNAQQSANRVAQMKHGITGASANEVMQSYAAKNQKNLNILYYNAAMKTGQQSLQAMSQMSAMKEKARQYTTQAVQHGVAGAISLSSGAIRNQARQLGSTVNPVDNLESGTKDPITVAIADLSALNAMAESMTLSNNNIISLEY